MFWKACPKNLLTFRTWVVGTWVVSNDAETGVRSQVNATSNRCADWFQTVSKV